MFDQILKVLFFPAMLILLVLLVSIFRPFFEELAEIYREWRANRYLNEEQHRKNETPINPNRWE